MSSELREPLKAVTECFADGFHLIKEVQLIAAHTEVVKFHPPLPPCVFLLLWDGGVRQTFKDKLT